MTTRYTSHKVIASGWSRMSTSREEDCESNIGSVKNMPFCLTEYGSQYLWRGDFKQQVALTGNASSNDAFVLK